MNIKDKDTHYILKLVGTMYTLRDILEELGFSQKLKRISNMWLKEANKDLMGIADRTGISGNEYAIELSKRFDDVLNESYKTKKMIELALKAKESELKELLKDFDPTTESDIEYRISLEAEIKILKWVLNK